jgi:predicted Zn-dependent peptidase
MRLPDTDITKVEMVVRGGFFQQLEEHIGYAHAVEHMLSFYTSVKYPSARNNEDDLSRLGIDGNAFTSTHTTGYWLTGLNNHLEYILDLMLHTITEPLFDITKLHSEKEAVKKELDRIINKTWYTLDTKINELIYNNTNCAFSTDYEKDNVDRLTQSLLEDTHDRYYIPSNIIFIVVSNHKHNQVFDMIENVIGQQNTEEAPMYYKLDSLPEDVYTNHDIVFVPDSKVDNYRIQFVVRFPFTVFDPEVYVLKVLDHIISDGLNSRLYKSLRDELGAVYFVSAYSSVDPLYPKLSNFNIVTETSQDRVLEVIEAIENVLQSIVDDKRLQREVEEYNNKLKTSQAMSNLSRKPDKYTGSYTPYLLWNKPLLSREEQHNLLMSVTSKDISSLSKTLFIPENVIIFYSGATEL